MGPRSMEHRAHIKQVCVRGGLPACGMFIAIKKTDYESYEGIVCELADERKGLPR